jgi:hypothetical protein
MVDEWICVWWNDGTGEDMITRRKTCRSVTLSTKNPIGGVLKSYPGHWSEDLGHGTALTAVIFVIIIIIIIINNKLQMGWHPVSVIEYK